jgi:hypothetical protein
MNMKLKFWYVFTIAGLLFVAAMTAIVGLQYGQVHGGALVDIATVLTALTMTAIPLGIGWEAGYWYAGDM